MIIFDVLDATDPRAHRDTDAVAVLLVDFEAGIPDCVHGGCDAVMHERVVLALLLRRQVIVYGEVLDKTCNTRRKGARVEILDQRDARVAFDDIAPGIVEPTADRGHDAHAGDDNASFTQVSVRV